MAQAEIMGQRKGSMQPMPGNQYMMDGFTPVSSGKKKLTQRNMAKRSRMSKGGYVEELSLPQALGQALTPSNMNIKIQSQISRV